MFDPASHEDAIAVLRGEGLKRLESFIFELLFQRGLQHFCSQISVAYGWYVVSATEEAAPLWIKLENEPLRPVDEQLIAFLDRVDCSILRVRYSEDIRDFLGTWRKDKNWLHEEQLAQLLTENFGAARPVSGPKSAPIQQAQAALDQLLGRLTNEERRALVLSRMLINCYIVPFLKTQPMDLDAVVLNEAGTLHFLEFKRKYPTASYEFGLDDLPHVALAEWLLKRGKTLSNIVLCDPLWNKNISPLHLLPTSATRPYAYWLGIHLTPEIIATSSRLKTQGKDSGMYSGDRFQIGISVDKYVVLGRSFSPKGLLAFINDEDLPQVNRDDLLSARNIARQHTL